MSLARPYLMFMCMVMLSIHAIIFMVRAAEAWPVPVVEPDFLPGCAELLLELERPALFQGGGMILFEQGDRWLALGAGTALIPPGGNQNPRIAEVAWKKADTEASAALVEAFQGITMDGRDSVEIISRAGGNEITALERFYTSVGREREGLLARSWEAGRWKMRDSRGNVAEAGVLRIVSSPDHPLTRMAGRIPVVSDTLDPNWRDDILSKPMLRHGGVAIALRQDGAWILLAGCVLVPKNVDQVPPVLMRRAEDNARIEWARFTEGVRVGSHEGLIREALVSRQGDEEVSGLVVRELTSRTESLIEGRAQDMIPIGMWLADAGKSWRLASVFRLPLESKGQIVNSYPMTRPKIPNSKH